MRYKLLDFQQHARDQLLSALRSAVLEVRKDDSIGHAITLVAPTGAGKTVIMASMLETIFGRHEDGRFNELHNTETSVLWLTANPKLAEQTHARFVAASETLHKYLPRPTESLKTHVADQLPAGIHLLNTQLLGKKSILGQTGDNRRITFWEQVNNTIEARPDQFFVIVDEAQIGASRTAIMQRFVRGHEEVLKPAPIVLGVSATPAKFSDLVARSGRVDHKCHIGVAEVQATGLIKETIRVRNVDSKGKPNSSVSESLKKALAKFDEYCDAWDKQGPTDDGAIKPLLLVQVEDGTSRGSAKEQLSQTDLDEVANCILAHLESREHKGDPLRHAFQIDSRKSTVNDTGVRPGKWMYGDREIQYIDPSKIYRTTTARVVVYKSALDTGWDCPRAEVMISFAKAVQKDYVAQIVGRLVRMPGRKKVDGHHAELLNGIDLYAPRFDKQSLDDVVLQLNGPDSTNRTGAHASVVTDEDHVVNPSLSHHLHDIKRAVSDLTTYRLAARSGGSAVMRLMRYAKGLERFNYRGVEPVLPDARLIAEERLRKCLEELAYLAGQQSTFQQAMIEAQSDIEVLWEGRIGAHAADAAEGPAAPILERRGEELVSLSDRTLYDRLDLMDRRLAGTWLELARSYADRATDATSSELGQQHMPRRQFRERAGQVLALLYGYEVHRNGKTLQPFTHLQDLAKSIMKEWSSIFETQIQNISDEERRTLASLLTPGGKSYPLQDPPELATRVVPSRARLDAPALKGHFYVPNGSTDDTVQLDLSGWEAATVRLLCQGEDVIGWLRNRKSRSNWALAIPYDGPSGPALTYPDILRFRRAEDGSNAIVVDIIDPHGLHLSDAINKIHGLARYAEQHTNKKERALGQVIVLAEVDNDGYLRSRDLSDPVVRQAAVGCRTPEELTAWYRGDATARTADAHNEPLSPDQQKCRIERIPPRHYGI